MFTEVRLKNVRRDFVIKSLTLMKGRNVGMHENIRPPFQDMCINTTQKSLTKNSSLTIGGTLTKEDIT